MNIPHLSHQDLLKHPLFCRITLEKQGSVMATVFLNELATRRACRSTEISKFCCMPEEELAELRVELHKEIVETAKFDK